MYFFIHLLVLFSAVSGAVRARNCETYNSDSALSYWEEVSNCSACTRNAGCGFCHSTLTCLTGEGTATTSGAFVVRTVNAGTKGVSGMLAFISGTTSSGTSGSITMATGKAVNGKGGDILVSIGSGNAGNGGDILLYSTKAVGGEIVIKGGRGESYSGGSFSLLTGEGTSTSSGAIIIKTVNAGVKGTSGKLSFTSGTTSSGASGSIELYTV